METAFVDKMPRRGKTATGIKAVTGNGKSSSILKMK
jgi:hypothetical protein